MICRHCDTDVERDELAGHLVGVHGLRLCVLCSRRGRVTEVETGHCCAVCRVRLDDQLADLVRLAADAAAHVEPSTGSGIPGAAVPTSRPPLDVDAVEPEMILVRLQADDPTSEEPILLVLESWCRLLRDERGFARYGPASAAHGSTTSSAVLTDVVRFLRGQLDYATTEPTFSLEQFADEIALCWRALLRYDAEREGALTWRVECPADIHGHTCGKGLRISGDDLDRTVRCPRCNTTWDVHRLLLVAAETTDGHMWLDAESITARTGVTRGTLDRWVKEGRIEKSHGRYDARPILVNQKGKSA